MIVARLSDPVLRTALRGAARPDEDVVHWDDGGPDALERAFPRLFVRSDDRPPPKRSVDGLPEVVLDREVVEGWDQVRRGRPIPPPRLDFYTVQLRAVVRREAASSWVDRVFADLERISGAPLPPALKAMGRRIMEYPSRYRSLHELARLTGLSRGALKARFRRRGLDSPHLYLRWFRALAVARVLEDPMTPSAVGARRLGMGGVPILHRAVKAVSGLRPSELRGAEGRTELLVGFAECFLVGRDTEGWKTLAEVFLEDVA